MSKRTLICMRKANMTKIHPDMAHDKCDVCGEIVGVYPSGQGFIQAAGRHNVLINCEKCVPPGSESVPLPGVVEEMKKSILNPWRKKS